MTTFKTASPSRKEEEKKLSMPKRALKGTWLTHQSPRGVAWDQKQAKQLAQGQELRSAEKQRQPKK